MTRVARRAWLPESLAASLAGLQRGQAVWLVGGAVRDAFLERASVDLDLVVDREAIALARRLADAWDADFYALDAERDIGRVLLSRADLGIRTLDFSGLRQSDIVSDLRARDFTINAMAVPLAAPGQLLDPCGGLQDLRDGRLRACSAGAIAADPVRALRAVRLAAELSLRIEPETHSQVAKAAPALSAVSAERIRDELFLIFGQPRPARALRVLDHTGLLAVIFPDLQPLRGLQQPPPHTRDAWDHTLAVVDALSDVLSVLAPEHDEEKAADLTLGQISVRLGRFRAALNRHLGTPLSAGRSARQLLFLSALYHDAGKPQTVSRNSDGRIHFYRHERAGASMAEARGRALRLSGAEVERLRQTVAQHMRPMWLEGQGSARAAYRFFHQAGEAGVDVVVLSLADLLGVQVPPPAQDRWHARLEVARHLLEAYFERNDQAVNPPPLVRGDELVETLGIAPGPEIGRLLRGIGEAQAAGTLHTRAEALDLARDLHQTPAASAEADDRAPDDYG